MRSVKQFGPLNRNNRVPINREIIHKSSAAINIRLIMKSNKTHEK